MKKNSLLIVILIHAYFITIGQETAFVHETIDEISTNILPHKFSSDGKYMAAVLKPLDKGDKTLLIRSMHEKWELVVRVSNRFSYYSGRGGDNGAVDFTSDNLKFIYLDRDTLHILNLVTRNVEKIANILSWKLSHGIGERSWLAYQTKNVTKEVVLRDLRSDSLLKYRNIATYILDESGKGVLLTANDSLTKVKKLTWVDLPAAKEHLVWPSQVLKDTTAFISETVLSVSSGNIAYAVRSKDGTEIGLYSIEKQQSVVLVDKTAIGNISNLTMSSTPLLGFTKDGSHLYFLMTSIKDTLPKSQKSRVDDVEIWSYSDPVIYPYRKMFYKNREFVACVQTFGKHLVQRLENNDQEVIHRKQLYLNSNYVIKYKWSGDIQIGKFPDEESGFEYTTQEWYWNKANNVSIILQSNIDGSERVLKHDMRRAFHGLPIVDFSPDGQFVLYYDEEIKAYCSYDMKTGKVWNISFHIPQSLSIIKKGNVKGLDQPYKISLWLPKSHIAFIRDYYTDIWKIDLSGKELPVCITNRYCKRNNLKIVLHESFPILFGWKNDQKIIASAFNKNSAEESLITMTTQPPYSVKKEVSGLKQFGIEKIPGLNESILLYTQDPKTPPMFFAGHSFEALDSLNDINRLIKINSKPPNNRELVKWKSFGGEQAFGVLFKPRDFNPSKKYPVIISYYEGFCIGLNSYSATEPGAVGFYYKDAIDRGYLYFVVDIHYDNPTTTGLQDAYNYVVSGAKYLQTLPYVNPKALGICGFSFGGFETNYIVSHTNIFAAAYSCAGASDYLSFFGIEDKDPQGFPHHDNGGQARLGNASMNNSKILIENSAVFNASKIETPFLLMGGALDRRVPVSQSIELFKLLRRFGKKAWLLKFNQFDHDGPANQFAIPFFDHYLKGLPAPIWMTRGVHPKFVGTGYGMEYDTEIKTPGPGLLIENK